jgi:DNA-binding LytR/AlgR family response regulator
LPENMFERIHKSYLVNLMKVKSLENNHIKIGDQQLPIGKSYIINVRKKLSGKGE